MASQFIMPDRDEPCELSHPESVMAGATDERYRQAVPELSIFKNSLLVVMDYILTYPVYPM